MPDPEELTLDHLLALADEEEEGEAGEVEEEEAPNPVIPEINEMLWAAVFFLALWAAMKYLLLPPLQKVRDERAARIRADRDAADLATANLQKVQNDYDQGLASARADASSVVDGARAEAEEYRSGVMAAAETDVATMRGNVQADIDSARSRALVGLRGDISSLAVGAASTVVGRPLDAAANQSVVDEVLGGSSEGSDQEDGQ